MQKYVIVSFLEPIEEGAQFLASGWPLHITLASNFVVDRHKNNLEESLKVLAARTKPINVQAGAEEYFGPNNNILVNPLVPSLELITLHQEVVALLSSAGAVFDEPKFINKGYRAHATVQRQARLNINDKIVIDRLSIVDMFPDQDIKSRKLIITFPFC